MRKPGALTVCALMIIGQVLVLGGGSAATSMRSGSNIQVSRTIGDFGLFLSLNFGAINSLKNAVPPAPASPSDDDEGTPPVYLP